MPAPARHSRVPPLIRLRATLLGLRMGELDVGDAGGAGQVQALALRPAWMEERVAARLFAGLGRLGPVVVWERLLWRLDPGDRRLRALAQAAGFRLTSRTDAALTFELDLRGTSTRSSS